MNPSTDSGIQYDVYFSLDQLIQLQGPNSGLSERSIPVFFPPPFSTECFSYLSFSQIVGNPQSVAKEPQTWPGLPSLVLCPHCLSLGRELPQPLWPFRITALCHVES